MTFLEFVVTKVLNRPLARYMTCLFCEHPNASLEVRPFEKCKKTTVEVPPVPNVGR